MVLAVESVILCIFVAILMTELPNMKRYAWIAYQYRASFVEIVL